MTRATATSQGVPFDPAVLKRIEERVAPLVGPVAPHLVRKTSRSAATVGDLCRLLADFIRAPEDRKRFLSWSEAELGLDTRAAPRRSTPPAGTVQVTWAPDVLDRARRDVAVYLGPLARILVRRVATRARDVRELYELLAREIPSEEERERFRRDAPR